MAALTATFVATGAVVSFAVSPAAHGGIDAVHPVVSIEPPGTTTSASRAVLALADGSSIVASRIDGATWVQRYSSSGVLDATFGTTTPGSVRLDAFDATSIRLDGSGRVLVLGNRTDIVIGARQVMVRMTTAGVVDGTFAGDAQPYGFGMDAFVEVGTRIVVTGRDVNSGGRACLHAIRASDGVPDPSFGNGDPGHACVTGQGAVTSVAAVRHGNGTFTLYDFVAVGSPTVTVVEAYDVSADGATVSAARSVGVLLGSVRTAVVSASGTLFAGGVSTDPAQGAVWRIEAEAVDEDFGDTGLAMARLPGLTVTTLAPLSDGRVIAGGEAGTRPQIRLLTADGLPDGALNAGTSTPDRITVPAGTHVGWTANRGDVADVAVDAQNRLLVAGTEWLEQSFSTVDSAGFLMRTTAIGAPAPIAPDAIGEIVPVAPERLFDTRPESRVQRAGGKPGDGETVEIGVVGIGTSKVPVDASAVVLNITATDVTAEAFVTVWPCGTPRPLASNLNVRAGATRPNLVIAAVGAGGRVCVFTQRSMHLIADITGYVPITSSYSPIVPRRVLETRADGQTGYQGAKPGTGQVIELQVVGTDLAPTGTGAVALNLTATEVDADLFVTVWPCGADRPTTSSLNAAAGDTTAVLVMAAVGTGGRVCIFTQRPAHLIADLSGWFPTGSTYLPIVPDRLLDTRISATAPSEPVAVRPAAGSVLEVQVTGGRAAVPADASVAVLSVVGVDQGAPGFLTVWPCGSPRPTASNVNLPVAGAAGNLVVVGIGAAGRVCVFTQPSAHLVVDLAGYLVPR